MWRVGLLLSLLLSACVPTPQYYINTRQTLLYGSDAAIYAGCVRGVIIWQHDRTGKWPEYKAVQAVCTAVQRSFHDDLKGGKNGDL